MVSLTIVNEILLEEILKYESLHNHLDKEFDVSYINCKNIKIKNEIRKISQEIFVDNGRPSNDIKEL
ncbi:hypothetical protein H8356DRAFT_1354138 [Neocallimastix lanati (nom. inval.)]|nr:hypothetical protein H8356DRAFT_1354138 [Neocallimastix sp. JGI-2020a]